MLIVDDQSSARRVLASIVRKLDNSEIHEASSLAEARQQLETQSLDVALIDLCLAGEISNRDGLTLVGEIRESGSGVVPIIVTASQEMAEVRMAMRLGAYDFILKDDLCEELVLPVLTGIGSRRRLEREVRELRARQTGEVDSPRLVGTSRAMTSLRETVRRVALSDRPVLVTGPTGSGKELVVASIHAQGPHPDEPLFDLNCGAIPESLMESQLFGHERGAFTGAERRQDGYLTLVRQGTLFLDEIAELPLPLQAKLLRVLETGRYRPVGAATELRFAGRVVAATHAELGQRVDSKLFREDLFYRLNVLTVPVPSLSERAEDVPALVAHFCSGQFRQLRFTSEALDYLRRAPWPGNVRQLRNLVDRISVFADADLITLETARGFLVDQKVGPGNPELGGLDDIARAILRLPIENKLQAVEDALVDGAMALCDGNKSAAARLLGVHRKALGRRIDEERTQAVMDKNVHR